MKKNKFKSYYLQSSNLYIPYLSEEKVREIFSDSILLKNYIYNLKDTYNKDRVCFFSFMCNCFLKIDKELGGTDFLDLLFTKLKYSPEYEQERYIKGFISLVWEGIGQEIYDKYIKPENRELWISNILDNIYKSNFIFDELSNNKEKALDYIVKTENIDVVLNKNYNYKLNNVNGKREFILDFKTRYMVDVYLSGVGRNNKIKLMNLLTTKYNLPTNYSLLTEVLTHIGLDYYRLNFLEDEVLNNIIIEYYLLDKDESTKKNISIINASKYNYVKKNLTLLIRNQSAYDFEKKCYFKFNEVESLFNSFIKDPFIKENIYCFLINKGKSSKSANIKAMWNYLALKSTLPEKDKNKDKVSKI